uniref:Folate_rec domain-containing protein n=1 Tax=Mesocestoides corti TaxID=53468 RepID=A0A5K3EYT4_MESCO
MLTNLFLISFCLPLIVKAKSDNRLLDITDVDSYVDICQESEHRKERPTPEYGLTSCTAWKENSCCTAATATMILSNNMHGFNYHVCGNLSKACHDFFNDEHCFVKCSPNLGPWLVKLSSSRFKERAFRVPLCESDCKSWYDACKDDLTCAMNWRSGGFDWGSGENACRKGFHCLKISEIYRSAVSFCERVWDHAYTVVPDTPVGNWTSKEPHCMHIPREGAPNASELVAHNHRIARVEAAHILKRVFGGGYGGGGGGGVGGSTLAMFSMNLITALLYIVLV